MDNFKQPPHSKEAEIAVLAGVLNNNGKIHDIDALIDSNDFYVAANKLIYESMWGMALRSQPIDLVTLSEAMQGAGNLEDAGGLDYLGEIQQAAYSAYNIESYATIVRDKSLERSLLNASHEIGEIVYSSGTDVSQKIEAAQKAVFGIEQSEADEPVQIDSLLKRAVNNIDERYQNNGKLPGMATGFADFDAMTGGLRNDKFVVVAGRPGQGKTVLAMNIAEHVAMNDGLVIVFNLEMTADELIERVIASAGRAPYESLRDGKIDDCSDAFSAGVHKLKGKPLYIDDNSGLTSANLASRARKISNKLGIKPALIVIDYLQLLNDESKHGPTDRITTISRNLKRTGRDLGCAVIAVSQLNRAVEQRPDKRPQLSDLRESGGIEQDADIVGMVYRDEYYNEDTVWKGIAEFGIKKHRGGRTGTIYLTSRLEMMRFDDMHKGFIPPAETTGKGKKAKGLDY